MTLTIALAVAILFGTGVYLLLKRDLFRVASGMMLITNATNLFIIAAGLSRGAAPILPVPAGAEASDPLVQALVLTAVVIGFGASAVVLSLIYQVFTTHDALSTKALERAEQADAAALQEKEAPV